MRTARRRRHCGSVREVLGAGGAEVTAGPGGSGAAAGEKGRPRTLPSSREGYNRAGLKRTGVTPARSGAAVGE